MWLKIPDKRRIIIINFITHVAPSLPMVYVAPIIARMGGIDLLIGLTGGLYSSAYLISTYIAGKAADEKGSKKVILLGLILSFLAFMLQFISNTLEMFIFSRILGGFAIGIFPAAITSTAHSLKIGMGKFSAAGSAGWAAGYFIATLIPLIYDYKIAFLISAKLFLVAFIITIRCRFSGKIIERVDSRKVLKKNLNIYITMFLRHTGANMLWTFWFPFLTSLGAPSYIPPLLMGINSFSQIIFMYYFVEGKSYRILILLGVICSTITFFYYFIVSSYIFIIPIQVLLGFSWSVLYVGMIRFLVDRNEEKATALGFLESTIGVSAVAGSVLGGIALQFTQNYKSLPLIASILSSSSLFLYIFLDRKDRRMKATGGI